MRRGFVVAAAGIVVVACAGCAADTSEAETAESFVGSAASVVGGKSGIRSIASGMNHDVVPLADGGAVTPVDQRNVTAPGQERPSYLYHAVEFVPASGDRTIHVDSPVPFWSIKAGPEGSALVLGWSAAGKALYVLRPSAAPELLAEGAPIAPRRSPEVITAR